MKSEMRPHFLKARHFEKHFPHKLESNEWKIKWPIRHSFGKTYNPDYWCEELKCFIELATSKPNISASRRKWAKAIKSGYPLRIMWWEGEDITDKICCFRPHVSDDWRAYAKCRAINSTMGDSPLSM